MLKSGVYVVRNKITGDVYIGSSKHLTSRWQQHRYVLRHRSGKNALLQEAWDEFGEDAFEFKILALVPPNMLLETEQMLINGIKPAYNISLDLKKFPPSFEKYRKTDEYKKKKSDDMKRWWKEGKFDFRKGINYFVKDGKPTRLGIHLSDEEKKHLSEINMGEKNPNFGLHRTLESKQKTSASNGKIYYGFVSPEGENIEQIRNMTQFCKDRNLNTSTMVAVARGKKKSHKGWTCIDPSKNQQAKTAKMLGLV